MNRSSYVLTFVIFAVVFVPVIFDRGIIVYITPTAYLGLVALGTLIRGKFMAALWGFSFIAAYVLLFYTAARVVFGLSTRLASKGLRRATQITALLALFSCSFARVITYHSLQGAGGTYSFWTAASRYISKHPGP